MSEVQVELSSVVAFRKEYERLDTMRRKLYDMYCRVSKPMTVKEIELFFDLDPAKKWQPRASELVSRGLLRKTTMRDCSVTGRMAFPLEVVK